MASRVHLTVDETLNLQRNLVSDANAVLEEVNESSLIGRRIASLARWALLSVERDKELRRDVKMLDYIEDTRAWLAWDPAWKDGPWSIEPTGRAPATGRTARKAIRKSIQRLRFQNRRKYL